MKSFNTTAVCIPSKHYMVDLSDRVREIKKLVDAGRYFTINRSRQYGKTTTLIALKEYLSSEYDVVNLDFQGIGDAGFKTEQSFVKAFCRQLKSKESIYNVLPQDTMNRFDDFLNRKKDTAKLDELFETLNDWCQKATKPVLLMIDEVDSATNNRVFLDFLAQLRNGYISRETEGTTVFHSVILAGVTDIKHLRAKIRPEDQHKVNSPWNIATDFDIDMSLSSYGIKGMLDEYEQDHRTGMNTKELADYIRKYTNGYPFLVSRICQIIDTKLASTVFNSLEEAWTIYGIDEAVKYILQENNTLFDSVMGKLINMPELKMKLRNILMKGETVAFLPDDEQQKLLCMYGFIYNNHNTISVSNQIFEMRLYNYYIGESRENDDLKQLAASGKSIFISNEGLLDMEKIMEHFIKEHNRIHGNDSEQFLEKEGRERFLTYLSPIINGTGTYSIEEQTRDQKRMDIVIHYLGRRYVIELKIWHGAKYNENGEKQVIDYLDYFGLSTGYMLSFSFNKKKECGVKTVQFGGKTLIEGVV